MAWIDGKFNRHSGVSSRWPGQRGTILALVGPSLIFVTLEDYDICAAPIFGMAAKWRSRATSSRKPRRTVTTFHGRFCWLRCSIRSTACKSRLIRDAVTILGGHVSRQEGQSPLHVSQELRLKAGPDFF